MVGVAIALAVVLAGKPAPSALKDCAVYGPAFGLDRFVRCANVTIEIYPPISAKLEGAALIDHARSAASAPNDKEVFTTGGMKVGGQKRPGYRYVKRRGGSTDPGLVIALPAGKAQSRIVHCSRVFERYCEDVLELTLRGLPPPTEAPPEGKPAIAGRPLEVPAGCARKGPAVLACGATELAWAQVFPGAPETLAEVDPFVRRANLHLGTLEGADRYCELEKTAALCRVATIAGKDGSKRRLAYGFVEVRGVRVFVSCATPQDLGEGFPSPCSQVMAIRPPE